MHDKVMCLSTWSLNDQIYNSCSCREVVIILDSFLLMLHVVWKCTLVGQIDRLR